MWRITFFFSQYNSSWTEAFYQASSVTTAQLIAQVQSVAQARLGMLGPQTTLQAVRLVLLSLPRASSILIPPTVGGPGTFVFGQFAPPDTSSAPNFMSLQVKFYSNTGATCRRYMAGAPEHIFGTQFSGRNVGDPSLWINSLTAFVAALANAGWSFRTLSPPNPRPAASNPVTSIQFPGEIGFSFQTQLLNANTRPQRLVLTGFRKVSQILPGISGVYRVDPQSPGLTAAVAPFTYYLQNTTQVQPSNISGTGTGYALAYTFPGFATIGGPANNGFAILSANHHKRGASALALRGRLRTIPH